MAVYDHIHKTTTAGLRPSVVEEFIERTLLENMKPAMVHAMDAQKRTLPLNNGKRVKFRKFDPMPAITTPLAEGVTPDGQSLNMTSFTAMVKPYGGYIEVTDEVDLYLIDNVTKEAANLLADQAALSLDTIARDALNAGVNVQYVGSASVVNPTKRSQIDATCILNYAEIKKAVRTLKRNNVKPCSDGYYHAIVHPDVVHDLTSDAMWVDVAKYQDKTHVQQNELGTIYKVKFFESTNAKIFKPKTYLFGTTSSLAASATYDAANKAITYSSTAITPDIARELTGQMVNISKTVSNTETLYPACIERIDVDNKKVYLRWDPSADAADAATWTTTNSLTIKPYGGGKTAGGVTQDVYSTLVYGADAFGSIELAGGGNVEVISKPAGSSGSDDPLNQRGTLGWKVKGFCAVILQDDFIIRLESAASA